MLDPELGFLLSLISFGFIVMLAAGINGWKKDNSAKAIVFISAVALIIIGYGVTHECAINHFCQG